MAQTNPFDLITTPTQDDAALLPGQQPVKNDPAQRYVPIDTDTEAAPAPRAAAPTRADVIKRAAAHGVDPALALSIWSQESSGNWNSKDSPKGARGGMQVMPGTFKAMMGDADQRDPWNNLEAGLRYIAYGQKTLGTTDPVRLAAGYHAGYDRKDLKAGIIPNTSDGLIKTADYARSVAARAGDASSTRGARVEHASFTQSDGPDVSRFQPLSDDEVKTYQATGDADLSRYVPMSADELASITTPGKSPETAAKAPTTSDQLSYLGKSLKAGGYDVLSAGAKILDALNPWTLSEQDAAVLFKNDPKKLKEVQDSSAAMILSRFAHHMNENADEAMKEAPKAAQEYYGAKEYATTDSSKAAWASPVKVVSDVVRNLPTMAAMAVTTYFTRGAAAQAERAALAEGLSADVARRAAVEAGVKAASKVGAATEGAVGYAQQAEGAYADASKVSDADMAKSPAYQNYLKGGFTPEAARAKVIADTAEQSGQIAGIVDAAVNHWGGQFLGKILTEGGSLIPRIMKGGATESITETIQSGGEQFGQNFAEKQHIDPNKDLTKGVGESMAQGAVVGFVSGGTASGIGGKGHDGVQPAADAPAQPRAEPTMAPPAGAQPPAGSPTNTPAAAPSPAAAAPAPSGPLSAALDTAAEEHSPDPNRVTVTAPTGEQASGKIVGYQEDENGDFIAQVQGDDGQVHTLTSQDGVKITEAVPNDSGPMTSALSAAADQHAEAPAPAPVPARPAKPAEPDYNAMSLDELRERMKYIATQAKASGGWNKMFLDARKAVEKAIKAKTTEAVEASKPAEEPLHTGPFEKRAEANRMMLRHAESTGVPHEVVESDGKFTVKPIQEQSNARVDTAGNVPAVADEAAAGAATAAAEPGDQQAGGQGVAQPAQERAADTGAPAAGAGSAVPGDGAHADAQPALTFKTAKGSTYTVNKDGSTIRNKAARPEHPGEEGVQPASKRTVYVSAEDAQKLGEIQTKGGARKSLAFDDKKGLMGVRYLDGKDAGKLEKRTVVSFKTQPEIGLTPVEFWGDDKTVHFGNEIVEVGTADAQPALTPKQTKALKRIEKGTAFFGTPEKTQAFIDEHGIGDTHEVKQTGAKRFEVVAKAAEAIPANSGELKTAPAQAAAPQAEPPAQQDKPKRQLSQREITNARQEEAVRQAAENLARRKAEKEAAQAAEPAKDMPTRDTRSAGVRFHGTSRALPGGKPNNEYAMSGDNRNIYGQGFYTTDAADISEGYMRKGKGSAPTLYEIKERGELKLYDMEQPMTPEVRAMAEKVMGDAFPEEDIDGKPITTLRELFDEYRDESANNGLTRDDVQEVFDSIRYNLEQQGYRGYRHIGGLKTDKKPHDVRIYWTPEDDIDVSQSDIAKYKGDAPAAEPKPEAPQPAAAEAPAPTQEAAPAPAANDDTPTKAAANDPFSQNKLFTTDAVEKARARLKPKLTQINSIGIDPEVMMDLLTIGGAYIESGVRKFSEFAKAVIDDVGPEVTPYLLSAYESARHYPGLDTDGMSSPASAQAQHEAMMLAQAEVAKPETSPTMADKEVKQDDTKPSGSAGRDVESKEKNRDDIEPTQKDSGAGAEGQAAEPVRATEDQRDAGRDDQPDAGDGRADDRGRAADGDRGGDQPRQARVRGRSDAAPADAEQPVQGGRGSRAEPGDRGNREPASGVSNYRIQPGELKREGSWRATAERNVGIVELVKRITAEGRQATPEEKAQLAKFTGWGASEIANGIFPDRYGRYKDAFWSGLGERLKAALTEEEYAQARRTTQYAHYTSESVIRSIYTGLDRLGFAGGTLLEPGMGVGSFNGLMPDHIAANSQYTGIEYEPITGAIAKLLYPQSNVIVGDFTRTNLPRDFFDAAIGNPPFSSSQVLNDPEYKGRRPMLHDYFFMKTIDRVKPGGVLVFVTSKGTMDKTSDKSRKYLAERANLLGAIRLPQTAFKDNAGTEVVTDVIFLQKRGPGIADNGVAWLGTKEVTTPQGATAINEYFADHPEMVLGTHALSGSMYRANEYTVLPLDGDIEAHFAEAIKRLPENITRPAPGSQAERAIVQDRDFNPKHKKEGGLYLGDKGALMQVESGSGVEVTHRVGADGKQIALTPKQKQWLKGYVGVRDALKQAQFDQLSDGNWKKSLKALNKAYDDFVAAHGPILDYTTIERTNPETGETTETKRFKNDALLRLDVEGALAYALETIKEDGTIVKGAALNDRVLQRPVEPEIKTTQDALFVSLNRHGALDLDDVARLAGTDKDSVIRDLGTAVYEAPGAGWQLADEYLSGNVVRKLKEAQAAADLNPKFKRNVDALLAVQPRPLGPTEITVRLGANWVPASDVATFAREVLGDQMDVTYNPMLGAWSVDQQTRSPSEWSFDKMSAGSLLDSILNSRQIKITWRDQDGKTHTDVEATEKANDIAGKMRERFRTWIWTDATRADRLTKYYNEHFNNIAPRAFDGSHLTLPGVSARYKLHPHQKRAVWRVVQQGDTYLAHAVGAGKTMEMIAAGMEERRLGLINKPMYVVPNHMLAQFSREFLELYPAANIMVADEQNFHTHNRKRFVAQAALNNPDAIVITHSAFGRVGMSDDYTARFIQNQIDAWKETLEDVDKGDRVTIKQIERRIEQLERRLEGAMAKEKKDKVLDFEELGVDKLYVDEFHEFRKLDFPTNQGNVKGIDPNGSQRALDLFMKVSYLREKKPGRALVAASGTPVTNTMGELFTAQRFFQPTQLEEDGLHTFDAWAAQYGDIVTGFEQNAAGGYEMVGRFAKFQNVPELMRRVRSFMDILTSNNLGALVKRPDVIGGGREVVVTPVPEGYKEYQQSLQSRIQAIRNRKGPPKKGEDIILNVIADGRFSAIDMRFVNPSAPSDPNSKLNLWIDDIVKAYRETADYEYADKVTGKPEPIRGASIIGFSDIGLGEASAANRGFDMRAWIEKRLKDAGIPAEHIAFMRDFKQHAKKERLFADMREGKRRILIGGKEMETGTNVQKRLTHLFHLDAPWFPASVEQREGRIIRQGNQNQQVKINAYATKGSYDSTMWGMNARKARFIEQAMNGDDSVRSMDDVSEASAFEMASALASGDERYLKLAGLKTDVERLERLRHAHHSDQNSLRREKHWAEDMVKHNEAKAAELKKAIEKRTPIRAGEFAGQVGKSTFDSREDFSQALFKAFKDLGDANFDGAKQVGEIGGFAINFEGWEGKGSGEYVGSLHLDLPGDPDPLLTYPIDPGTTVAGIATRAANQVNGLDRELATAQNRAEEQKRRLAQIKSRLGAAFPEEAILMEKVAELNALQEELAKEGEANAEAAAATIETEGREGDEPAYSVSGDAEEGSPEQIARFADEVRQNPRDNTARLVRYGEAGEKTVAAFAEAGVDVTGYKHIVDNSAINHVLRQHGDAAKEEARGQFAVTPADFAKLPDVVANPDKVELGGKTRQGRETVRYTKRINGHVVVVEEARTGRKSLALVSMWKTRPRSDAQLEAVPHLTPEAPQSASSSSIVGQNGKNTSEAIARLMADKAGEVVIQRAGIGAITITYGDKDAGLAHIVARRGEAFAARLPDLLANGEVYTKPGQDRRVFIGNERDEAVIRTDRDGKPENWLLSAYEKYPEGRQSRTEAPAPYVRMSDTELKAALTHGPIGSVIARLIEHGTIQIHRSAKTLPKSVKVKTGVQAVTMPDGSMHLVAGALTRDNARAVLLHEMFHGGVKPMLGSAAWGDLMGRIGSLYRQSEQSTGRAREVFDRARERVAAAKAKGAVATRMEVEEFAAYAIEEYERAPDSLPAAIRKWVEDLIGLVKAYIARRYGRQIGQITPAQLAGFAKMAILDMAAERRGELFGPMGELFSMDDERTVEVDGVRRPIRDSDGNLIEGGDFARQVQFWRRFDGPVDEMGRPVLDEVRFSVGAAPATQGTAGNGQPAPSQPGLTPPEQGRLRRLQAAVQDNQNRVKQVQERIMDLTGRTNLGKSDYYGAETNRPGRIAARLEDADDQMFQPLIEKLAKAGKTPEQLGELLHAMHAHERNEAVSKINPDMPDGGSGMTDAEANAILAKYKNDQTLHALANDARAIARATLDLKHAYGLITDEHYDKLTDMYDHYVPLKGDGEYGPKVKRAMGHEARDEHILENIARDYDQAVVVGEKNLARQSLLRMALQFPDPDLWTVGVPPKGRYVAGKVYDVMKGAQKVATFDSQAEVRGFLEAQGPAAINFHVVDSAGERVAEFTKPLQDNEVMVYVKGDAVRIQIHDETLARQIRPLDAARLNPILEFMRGTNRFLSKIYTGYNPAFILRNATRDAMTGTINMLGNNGAAVAAKAWTKYPAAAKTLAQWAATKKIPAGKMGAYLTEYRQQGGKVGASYMSDLEEQGQTLQSMFDNARGVAATLKDGGKKRAAAVAWNKSVGRLAHVVEIANQATENALRLGLFVALREEGVSAAKAAQAAKQVTVDFDRKGTSTGALGAVYLFFNPAIQGSANALKTLVKGEHKQQAWAALGAVALLGAYAAASGMGDDRDRWLGEEWENRTKNFLLNVGGHQLRLPLSQEYAPVYGFGVALAEALHGESSIKAAAHVVSSFIDAYFPLQGAYRVDSDNHVADLAQAATPTVFKPLTNTALNRNAFGSQIVPDGELTKDRPDSLKMYRGTKNSAYDKAAQGIASVGEIMGAGKYENDVTKVSPETLKEFWRTYTGGLGAFVTDSLGLAGMMAEPGQVESGDVPIVKDFVRAKDVKPIRARYFDLARDAHAAITEFEQAKKAGDGQAIEKMMADEGKAQLVGMGRMVRATAKAAAALGDEKVDINSNPNLSGAEKRAKLKEIEQQEERLYRSAIQSFK